VVVASKVGIRPNHADASARCVLCTHSRGARLVHKKSEFLLFAAGEHRQSRISIHRCYKRVSGRGVAGCLETRFQGYYAVLSRILQTNFREFLF
jgi:hypothetical protein